MSSRRSVLILGLALMPVLPACEPETPPPPGPNQTCWGLQYENEWCPVQACLPKTKSITLNAPSGPGFTCNSDASKCTPLPVTPGSTGEADVGLAFEQPEYLVQLVFGPALLKQPFSLQGFRDNFKSSAIWWMVPPDNYDRMMSPDPAVQFLSYENGVLHIRTSVDLSSTRVSVDTPPHLCYSAHLGNQEICSYEMCYYEADPAQAASAPIRFNVELTLPVPPQG